jgi:gamma-butyrobetaine dioxygenase
VTGQRLIEITSIDNGCGVTVEAQTAASVAVVFAPDGHRATFSRGWLTEHALPGTTAATAAGEPFPRPARSGWLGGLAGVPEPPVGISPAPFLPKLEPGLGLGFDLGTGEDPRTEDGKRLWRAADLDGPLPGAAWDEYLASRPVRERCLDAVARLGFALLRDVPVTPGTVAEVAATFGFVRETNYGRVFDVRAVADPGNLAYTCRAIPPHTDNPYRDPVPTLQLLHCLRDADAGGDTGLVDGFAAAAALRAADPAAFALLTSTPWPFAYADERAELRARQPLITLTADGRITAVRVNNRSMAPLRVPAPRAAAAYDAYRTWAGLLARPEFRLSFRLAPGDCLILDNTRIPHARTAFTPAGAQAPDSQAPDSQAGERHLQGCYADIDGLLSALAVLRRPAAEGGA